jgi:hypothetical protein
MSRSRVLSAFKQSKVLTSRSRVLSAFNQSKVLMSRSRVLSLSKGAHPER